jgi:hypothetical protein
MPIPNQDEVLLEIARQLLGFETLETRNSDDLDFRDVAVWRIRQALERAYAAGQRNDDADLGPDRLPSLRFRHRFG